MANTDSLQVTVAVEAGADAREREELTVKLRRELRQLPHARVDRPAADAAPPGTRAIDMAAVGQLLVTVAPAALGAVVAALRSWLGAHGSGTIRMTIGSNTLELDAGRVSAEDQRRLVDTWIKANTPP